MPSIKNRPRIRLPTLKLPFDIYKLSSFGYIFLSRNSELRQYFILLGSEANTCSIFLVLSFRNEQSFKE